ncbi:MAG: hypothetical protein AAB354_08395 [candidate division KSB1 bacterium]
MIAVSNSSPLIILYKCNGLGLLKQFFGGVVVPQAVYDEVVHQTKDLEQSATISGCDFIKVHELATSVISFSRKLDRGEQEALALATELHADFLLLDDKRAQKEAALLNIPFIPTFALLVKAAQDGLISDFNSMLTELQQKGIFLSRELSLAAHAFIDRD